MSVRIRPPAETMDARLRPLRRPFFAIGAYVLMFIWTALQSAAKDQDWNQAFQGSFLLYGIWGWRQAHRERSKGRQSGLLSTVGLAMWAGLAALSLWGLLGGRAIVARFLIGLFGSG